MLIIFSLWGFVNFIYLKIVLEFAFDEGINIFSDFLISIILSITIFISSGTYAKNLFFINGVNNPPRVSLYDIVKITIIPFSISFLLYCLICRGIVFGFDKDLSSTLSSDYNSVERFILFYASVSFPLLCHYLITIFPTYNLSNSRAFEDDVEIKDVKEGKLDAVEATNKKYDVNEEDISKASISNGLILVIYSLSVAIIVLISMFFKSDDSNSSGNPLVYKQHKEVLKTEIIVDDSSNNYLDTFVPLRPVEKK